MVGSGKEFFNPIHLCIFGKKKKVDLPHVLKQSPTSLDILLMKNFMST